MNSRADAHRIEGREALVAAIIELLAQARQRVRLHAPRLEAGVWADPRVVDAIRGFVTGRSHRELQLLVERDVELLRDHAGLVALHQRLPTLIHVRTPQDDEVLPEPRLFLLADNGGLLLGDVDPRASGAEFTHAEAGSSRVLAERFDQAWLRANPMTGLRALGL